MTVYSCHKTGISLADIKLKGPLSPPFLSLSFSRRRETYRRDRFLAYNILSLVANREETKARARLSVRLYRSSVICCASSLLLRAARSPFSFLVFLRISSHDSATRRVLRHFNAPMPPAMLRALDATEIWKCGCTVVCTVTAFRGGDDSVLRRLSWRTVVVANMLTNAILLLTWPSNLNPTHSSNSSIKYLEVASDF